MLEDCDPDPLAVAIWKEKSLMIGFSGIGAATRPSWVTTLDMKLSLLVTVVGRRSAPSETGQSISVGDCAGKRYALNDPFASLAVRG
mgnify:CR=1 FL=1